MNRNCVIDLAKLIAALLVVAIHTALFVDVDSNLYFVFNELLCRLAVPFFAICTGYYLSVNKVKRQWVKLVGIYLLWTILYFLLLVPNWISTGWMSVNNCLGYCKSAFLSGSYFHLWYLLYVIYALPVFWVGKKYLETWGCFILALFLWTVNAWAYGYHEIMPSVGEKTNLLINSGYAITQAQFCMLPLLLAGSVLQQVKMPNATICGITTVAMLTGLYLEGTYVKSLRQTEVSYIFMILPTAIALFALLQNIHWNPKHSSKLLRCSLIIYCVHPMFCKYIHSGFSVIDYICVCLLSVMTAYTWESVKNKCQLHAIR